MFVILPLEIVPMQYQFVKLKEKKNRMARSKRVYMGQLKIMHIFVMFSMLLMSQMLVHPSPFDCININKSHFQTFAATSKRTSRWLLFFFFTQIIWEQIRRNVCNEMKNETDSFIFHVPERVCLLHTLDRETPQYDTHCIITTRWGQRASCDWVKCSKYGYERNFFF